MNEVNVHNSRQQSIVYFVAQTSQCLYNQHFRQRHIHSLVHPRRRCYPRQTDIQTPASLVGALLIFSLSYTPSFHPHHLFDTLPVESGSSLPATVPSTTTTHPGIFLAVACLVPHLPGDKARPPTSYSRWVSAPRVWGKPAATARSPSRRVCSTTTPTSPDTATEPSTTPTRSTSPILGTCGASGKPSRPSVSGHLSPSSISGPSSRNRICNPRPPCAAPSPRPRRALTATMAPPSEPPPPLPPMRLSLPVSRLQARAVRSQSTGARW